jgi:3-isopropylmalate/(R)-2-methylmalate dehydratase small subunit
VIAPSFSDIFSNNCTKNGLVPVVLSEAIVEAIWAAIDADHETEIVVDVERLVVEVPAAGIVESFPMDPATQHRYLHGLDDVGITMTNEHKIDQYESNRHTWLP